MKFITRCVQCGDQNQLGDDETVSIQLYFHRGSPNISDRMVTYCANCGNSHEIVIPNIPQIDHGAENGICN